MLSTKSIAYDIAQIPREWVFEHYLNIPKLTKDIKIKSLFTKEDAPSMFIYKDEQARFLFKDFSSGHQGDGVELVKLICNLKTRWEATLKIIDDFNKGCTKVLIDVSATGITEHSNYKVVDWKFREWNSYDADYWLSFHIGSEVLKKFCVKPLEYYSLHSDEDNNTFQVRKQHVYAYCKHDDSVYKIYQPFSEVAKFIKITAFVQGIEQLDSTKPFLCIHKALKDIMFFQSLGYTKINCIAPDSENAIIPPSVLYPILYSHQRSCTLFDNDSSGINGMKKYNAIFNLPYIVCPLEKDISDSGKMYGRSVVKKEFNPLFKKVFYG